MLTKSQTSSTLQSTTRSNSLSYNDTQTATSSTSSITSSTSSRKSFTSASTVTGTPKVKKRGSAHVPPETKVKKNVIIQDLQSNNSREALSHEGSDPVSYHENSFNIKKIYDNDNEALDFLL